jgi:hypothetical protein
VGPGYKDPHLGTGVVHVKVERDTYLGVPFVPTALQVSISRLLLSLFGWYSWMITLSLTKGIYK